MIVRVVTYPPHRVPLKLQHAFLVWDQERYCQRLGITDEVASLICPAYRVTRLLRKRILVRLFKRRR